MAIFIAGISQSNEEMKCVKKNKIEYGGEIIKLKRAIELSEGVSEDAIKDFKSLRWFKLRTIGHSLLIPSLIGFGVIEILEGEDKESIAYSFLFAAGSTLDLLYSQKQKSILTKSGVESYNNAIQNK
ncbi:MAG: hypothetical protein P8L23_06030 [Flavobacteriales bacterium]|nr:hypothetical protein [Flavobacteriales bacterium]